MDSLNLPMENFNIEFLIETSEESIILDLRLVFENLLREIGSYLNLESIYSNVQITFRKNDKIVENQKNDIINFGVERVQKNKFLTIYISNGYEKCIKIILLREAYKCFVPLELQENRVVNLFIDQKVEIDLQKSGFIEDWRNLKRKNLVSYNFMEAEFDRLEKFLKQGGTKNRPSPFQFFFSYIRKNVDLIWSITEDLFSLGKKSFYDKIFEDYIRKYTNYPYEILETIRIITEIFYRVKSYHSLLDYKQHFQEFKESGVIKTALTLRKFTENMQWIKNNSNIAPTYKLNWFVLNIKSILCYMKFHPLIESAKIFKIIKQLPFFINPTYSKSNFGIEFIGYFIFPKKYLKEIYDLLEKLKLDGFLIEKKFFINQSAGSIVNLNCATSRSIILNPDKKHYKQEFEIKFSMNYGFGSLNSNLSLLDWLLIDRIRYVSITGLGFERKSEILRVLKSDLLNEIETQRNLINEVKENLEKINTSNDLKEKILGIINNNQTYGFFYIKQMLNDYISAFEIISNILNENPSIYNKIQFQEFVQNQGFSKVIDNNILLRKFKKNLLGDLISIYFKSKKSFVEKVKEYRYFYNIFESFNNLKLFNLESMKSVIKDKSLIQKIYRSKEKKLKQSYEGYKSYKIAYQLIEQRLEDFLLNNSPVIQPLLLNTIMIISRFTKFSPIFILKDNKQIREGIEKLKLLFPRVVINEMTEYESQNRFIYFRIFMPNLSLKEKQIFYSIIYNFFKKNIVIGKSYLFSGFTEAFSMKDFYDLEREDFFYTKDLFEQFYSYMQKTFNRDLEPISESTNDTIGDLWAKKMYISHLVNETENRLSREVIDLNINNLNNLISYHKNLHKYLLHVEKFKNFKVENFFKKYIKAIKFIPSFQSFGFGEYYVYFYPTDLTHIDFKHFLHNSFQKVKFPASFDNSNSFLIKFIWPYRNPNNSLLNWLNKSKRVIREYCLFFIKRVFQIFHFNYNLSVNEWDLDPNRFKIYFQNILFNPDYNLTLSDQKEFNLGDVNISNYLTPESSEFKALTRLYNWKSVDIKSYLGTRNYSVVNQIIELLEKKLIFPFISVKNLDLKEKISIILPDVKKKHNEAIRQIFSFFNIGFIYEIEGEYYIQGFTQEIKFENGIMINLYLPDCQLDEFEILFDLIFEFLKIEHYVILNDLVDGKNFLKSIYGSLDFMKSYNPIKNLKWNQKDKRWLNNKLFNEKFEKIYPNLID